MRIIAARLGRFGNANRYQRLVWREGVLVGKSGKLGTIFDNVVWFKQDDGAIR